MPSNSYKYQMIVKLFVNNRAPIPDEPFELKLGVWMKTKIKIQRNPKTKREGDRIKMTKKDCVHHSDTHKVTKLTEFMQSDIYN